MRCEFVWLSDNFLRVMKIVFNQWFGLIFTLVIIGAFEGNAASPKYNVLFIAVDDLRPELGCYGHPLVKSPNIDRFAASGLQFNRAYCQFALCNPSRSSLLSGRRPETLKVFDLATFLRKNNPDLITLPQLFKQNGYESRSYGKVFHITNGNHEDDESWSVPAWHSLRDDVKKSSATKPAAKPKKIEIDPDGADHKDELPYESPDVADDKMVDGQIANAAIRALRELKDKPFFLGVGFHRPHLPFIVPKKYWDLYDPKTIRLAPNPFLPKDAPAFASNDAGELRRYKGVPAEGPISEAEALKLVQGYYASVSFTDAQFGKLLNELENLGLREKTIVILWGDHGYQLGEHATWTKRTNWEIATRVPLLFSAPNQKATNRRTDALIEFVDIFPTLSELCRLPIPAGLEGTSFVPLLNNPQRTWKSAAFSIYAKPIPELGKGFGRAMRTERYRFIEWSAPGNEKRVYELYDHQSDPQENVNIANLPKNKDLIATLSKQLQAGWKGALPK